MFYRPNITVKNLMMFHKKYSGFRTQLSVHARILKTCLSKLHECLPSKHSSWWRRLEDVFLLRLQKKSSRRHQNVLIKTNIFALVIRLQKTSSRRFGQDQYIHLGHTPSRRLQDVLQKRLQDIFKTSCKSVLKISSRRRQDVSKTSSRCLAKMSSRRFQEVSSS